MSSSVADAIDFCREDLQLEEFQNSEATTEFIRIFDSLFDCFNSKSLFGKQFKAPISVENYRNILILFDKSEAYIKSLSKENGQNILSSKLKTGYLGFICAIHSFKNMFQDMILKGPLTFLLGYKFSQDHLELFNGHIRSALGANNNPTCKQFESIFKRMLVKLELRGVKGNCTKQDETVLLSGEKFSRPKLKCRLNNAVDDFTEAVSSSLSNPNMFRVN